MITTVRDSSYKFQWIDVQNPTIEELEGLAQTYNLPGTAVRDCLEPEHHPKIELFDSIVFVIMRAYDAEAPRSAKSVRTMTRKIALFIVNNVVITVSRTQQTIIESLKHRWTKAKTVSIKHDHPAHLLSEFLRHSIDSFEKPIEILQDSIEELGQQVAEDETDSSFLKDAISLRRQSSVVYRVTSQMAIVAKECVQLFKSDVTYFRDVLENSERIMYMGNQIAEDLENLTQLSLSLSSQRLTEASHKTNEVMRLLTVFSVFFMPLNLIAGIYGMNFEHMPELRSQWGYPLVIGTMVLIITFLFIWFRKRGWLSRE